MGTHWIVSAHASSYPNVVKGRETIMHKLVQIPAGVSIHFYCKEGVPLSVGEGYELLNLLVDPSTAEGVAKQRAHETRTGLSCPDYWVWGDDWRDRLGSASGIFKVGRPRHTAAPTPAGIAALAKGDFSGPKASDAGIARLAKGDFTRDVLSSDGGLLAKNQYMRLSTVLRWCHFGDHVHWLACRTWV